MKVFIFLSALTFIVAISRVASQQCPDGQECNGGICCKKYPLVPVYMCCRGVNVCRRSFGFGYCYLYSNEKAGKKHSLSTTTEMMDSQESYEEDVESEDDSEKSDEVTPEDQEFSEYARDKMAFADALLDLLKKIGKKGFQM